MTAHGTTAVLPGRRIGGVHLKRSRLRIGAAWLAFGRFRRTRPFWAGVWTMLGGTVIAYVPATGFKFLFANGMLGIGVLVGVVTGVCGLLLWVQRYLRFLLGIVIILLSLLSFMTSDFGGLLLGMVMGLIGGCLALSWAPAGTMTKRKRRKLAAQALHQAAALEVPAEVEADAIVEELTITLPAQREPAVIDLRQPAAVDLLDAAPRTITVLEQSAAEPAEKS